MPQDQDFQQRVERISGLVEKLEETADPAVRSSAKELITAVMELHAAGIERAVEIVSRSGAGSTGLIASFTRDPLLSSLLVLHGLHPDSLETRVKRALAGVPGTELIALELAIARVKVKHGGEAAVREALSAAAPDLTDVVIEAPENVGFVPVSALGGSLSGTRS